MAGASIKSGSVRKHASAIEVETRRFYERAATLTRDAGMRQLLDNLVNEERSHERRAEELDKEIVPANVKQDEEQAQRRLFVLQIVQPGLAGLMDGSVSTLAPVFAAALATHNSWDAFLIGMAASVGAGISMGFAEALSDDGSLTGRGHPWVRGVVTGAMTSVGGVGHTLPFLIHNFGIAMTLAALVVVVELSVITWIRHRYMDTPTFSAALQVGLGGVLVFLTGILIGILEAEPVPVPSCWFSVFDQQIGGNEGKKITEITPFIVKKAALSLLRSLLETNECS